MQGLRKVLCIAYLLYLTGLLLSPQPERLVGGELPGFLHALMPAAHFLSFLVLAVLALSTRWPAPRWAVLVLMAAYGGMTEILQGFVPFRTPDWMDWFQDLAGIGVGAGLCWTAAMIAGRRMKLRVEWNRRGSPAAPDQWQALPNAGSQTVGGGQSWWS